jgi:HPt (histidine-containing phosphotransfer) domain-containing protein
MSTPDFDSDILEAFLQLGGEDTRDALVSQVRADLLRCQNVFATQKVDEDTMADLRRTAHEVKGIGATIGATRLADLARATEFACAQRKRAEAVWGMHALQEQIRRTILTLEDLARE